MDGPRYDGNGEQILEPGPKPGATQCLGCLNRMTWDARKRQYNRAIARGLTADEAKAAMPRCQKCMTVFLKSGR